MRKGLWGREWVSKRKNFPRTKWTEKEFCAQSTHHCWFERWLNLPLFEPCPIKAIKKLVASNVGVPALFVTKSFHWSPFKELRWKENYVRDQKCLVPLQYYTSLKCICNFVFLFWLCCPFLIRRFETWSNLSPEKLKCASNESCVWSTFV